MDFYPDYDDYQFAAEYALTATGLDAMTNTEGPYWDSEARATNNLGLVGTIDLDAVDTDYFDDHLTATFPGPVSRALHFTVYTHGNDSLTARRNAYISVGLTDVEAEAVIAFLVDQEGDDFWDDSVSYWRRGDVRGMMNCFGYSAKGLRETWTTVGEALEEVCPDAFAAWTFAHAARVSACATFAADVDYLRSEEWAEERRTEWAEAEADLAERERRNKYAKLHPVVQEIMGGDSGGFPDLKTAAAVNRILDALEA